MMEIDESLLRRELAIFADLGTEPPETVVHGDRLVVRMFRNGEEVELQFRDHGAGTILERSPEGDVRTHASYRALLASERFGNLRRWAASQRIVLKEALGEVESMIRTGGVLSSNGSMLQIEALDDLLVSKEDSADTVRIMLIDGPAGIGKTKFIEVLALRRAQTFLTHRRPLILHVESRGRVLTFLQDLIAFSLQRLRLLVTYDQVPIFVRHGLVTLSIDGFDELGDPNGYDLAWGQINELVTQIRGRGTLVLAGRETFIGAGRIERKITSLKSGCDAVDALTLLPPEPDMAKSWLRTKGWTVEDLEAAEELFETGSYALRPFFLTQLAEPDNAAEVRRKSAGSPLGILVKLMIAREAGKFGETVNAVLCTAKRREFVTRFLREVARNMAEEQTESLDTGSLAWLVDYVVPESLDTDTVNILKNRAAVIAFLTNDATPGYRRFAQSQLHNYFLGEETLDAIASREIPKYVRRNILGADFLAAFSDLAHYRADATPERLDAFFDAAVELAHGYLSVDRGTRNLAACLVTMLPAMGESIDLRIGPVNIDEALMKGTAPPAVLDGVVVNQLDIRGADLHELTFTNSTVVTLIVDETARVPPSFPTPATIRNESHRGPGADIWDRTMIEEWLDGHGRASTSQPQVDDPSNNKCARLLRLINRACRSRTYWIPEDMKERHIYRFVRDSLWPEALDLLRKHNLVREDTRAASGPGSRFFHIKRPMDILRNDDPNDHDICGLYQYLSDRS